MGGAGSGRGLGVRVFSDGGDRVDVNLEVKFL